MRLIALSLAALTLTACGNTAPPPAATVPTAAPAFSADAVRSHVAAANKVYGERFGSDDPAWYAARYTADACAMPENMPAVCGRDAIRDYYFNNGGNKDFRIVIRETAVYGGADAVVEEGRYDFPDGKGGSFDKGKFIAIWKQDGGAWKLHREIWNSDVPPQESPADDAEGD